MKHHLFTLFLGLCLVLPLAAQSEKSPQSKPTSRKSTKTGEPQQKKLTEKQRALMVQRDLILPPMVDPIDEGHGVKWCYLRRSRSKKRLLRPGDSIMVHLTLWDQKSKKEFMSTRRRGGRGHGLGRLNVGVSIRGLDMVFPKLRVGDKVRIDLPSEMAFGAMGVPSIPPNSDVIYALEVHKIVDHIDFPKPAEFDEKKSKPAGPRKSYVILKDGTGPVAGDTGIVVYDFMATADDGRIIDFSKLREHAILGGQAGKATPPYLRVFSPLARVGTEFLVRMDFEGIPLNQRPFLLGDSHYLYMHLFTRWVVPFDPSTKNMKTSETGLKYEILEPGEGEAIKDSHHVTMHYAWWTKDGNLIESSYARGGTNTLRQVALPAGMVEGLHKLRPGGKMRLYVPSELAWGQVGRKDVPPNTDIIMKIEFFKSQQLDPVRKKPKKKAGKK